MLEWRCLAFSQDVLGYQCVNHAINYFLSAVVEKQIEYITEINQGLLYWNKSDNLVHMVLENSI